MEFLRHAWKSHINMEWNDLKFFTQYEFEGILLLILATLKGRKPFSWFRPTDEWCLDKCIFELSLNAVKFTSNPHPAKHKNSEK